MYQIISHKILRLLQTNEFLMFYSFDKICKKLRELQVYSNWLTLSALMTPDYGMPFAHTGECK